MPRAKLTRTAARKDESSDLSTPPAEAHSDSSEPAPRARSTRKRNAPASDAATPSKRAKRDPRGSKPSYKEESGSDEAPASPKITRGSKGRAKADSEDEAEVDAETTDSGPLSPEPEVKSPAKQSNKVKTPVKATKAASRTTPQKAIPSTSKATSSKPASKAKANGTASAQAADGTPQPKRKRKTAEEKAAEAMPLAARTAQLQHHFGAHVSAAGGVHNAVTNALHIGGNAFALFLKSQRKWDNPPLKPEHLSQFTELCAEHDYAAHAHVLPHGSYLVNLAQADPAKAAQAYAGFLDDLQRCEKLGIKLYNFHPGNTNGTPRADAIRRLAGRLNDAHKETSSVVTVLENMAAAPTGNTIGGCWEDLRAVIDQVHDKSRVGVCIDTCHAFAAGYDLRSPEAFAATMHEFGAKVGFEYLKAIHLNDSKAPLGAHRDLHQNLGLGFLGLRAFHNVANESRFEGLPIILETPIDRKDQWGKSIEDQKVWAREIKLMESLKGMDVEGEEFKRLERELAEQGEEERAKFQGQFEKKLAKETKDKEKAGGAKGRGRKKKSAKETEDEDEDSDGR